MIGFGLVSYVKSESLPFPITKEAMRALWYQETTGNNLALGKQCIFSPEPSYALTKNENDPWELTDGELACKSRNDDRIWVDKDAVGWYDYPFAYVGIDLEEEKSIEKVVLRILGGKEQSMLVFPKRIQVLLSVDGENYYEVSEWQKTVLGDTSKFVSLPEEGKHYVYPFSLDCGSRLARFVVIKIESAGFLFLDEIAVMEGSYPPTSISDGVVRVPFKLDSALLWSEVEKLWICNNMPIYERVLFADLRNETSRVSLIFELPQGIELVKLFRGWSETEENLIYKEVTYDGRVFNQYSVRLADPKPYEPIRILLATNWDVEMEGEAFLYTQWQDGQQERLAIPIETYSIESIVPPKRLHTSIAWMTEGNQKNWPNFFEVYKNLGFNAVPFFPRYGVQTEWLNQARELGFSILYNESPIHEMAFKFKDKEEIYVLNKDGTRGSQVSLAYRGQYYQHEMQRIAQLSGAVRPDWIFFDIELFTSLSSVAGDQQVVQRMEEEQWDSIPEACIKLGTEMLSDISTAAKSWVSNSVGPKVGFYDVKPPKPYGGVFNFWEVYPNITDFAQPSLYVGGDLERIGNQIRSIREELPQSDIIPWLTAGTYGEFPSQTMRDMILEVFFNGSYGITFYSIYDFNSLDLKYTSEAIAIAAKVEDIIMDGQLIIRDKLTAQEEGVRVTGLSKDNGEAAILVSSYTDKNERLTGIFYNVSVPSKVIDLDDDSLVGIITPEKTKFCVPLTQQVRSKAFRVVPIR